MILACDPGHEGAFATIADGALMLRDMPTYIERAGQRNKERAFIDRPKVIETLLFYQMMGAEILVIEKVGGIPGQAAHGAFTFGHGAGGVTYAAEALGYRVEEVAAMRWKSALKVPPDKKLTIARASELFPAYVNLWAPVRGNGSESQRSGRAEAAMLAKYGEQTLGALAC